MGEVAAALITGLVFTILTVVLPLVSLYVAMKPVFDAVLKYFNVLELASSGIVCTLALIMTSTGKVGKILEKFLSEKPRVW